MSSGTLSCRQSGWPWPRGRNHRWRWRRSEAKPVDDIREIPDQGRFHGGRAAGYTGRGVKRAPPRSSTQMNRAGGLRGFRAAALLFRAGLIQRRREPESELKPRARFVRQLPRAFRISGRLSRISLGRLPGSSPIQVRDGSRPFSAANCSRVMVGSGSSPADGRQTPPPRRGRVKLFFEGEDDQHSCRRTCAPA